MTDPMARNPEPSSRAGVLDQLKRDAEKPKARIQLGRSTIELSSTGWYGPKPSKPDETYVQFKVFSVDHTQGDLGDILNELLETFRTPEATLEIPSWLKPGPGGGLGVALRHLSAGLEKRKQQNNDQTTYEIVAVEFGLEIKTGQWVLVENLLTVSGLETRFSVLWEDEKRPQVQLTVCGKLEFAGAPLQITAAALVRPGAPPAATVAKLLQDQGLLDDNFQKTNPGYTEFFTHLEETKLEPQVRFDFEVDGRLDREELNKRPVDKRQVTLGGIMRHFGWSAANEDPLTSLEIKELEMGFSTAPGSYHFLLELADTKLEHGNSPASLRLNNVYLEVNGSIEFGASGALGCKISFAENVNAQVMASCERAGSGWIFEGRLSVKDGEELSKALREGLGVSLPGFVSQLKARSAEKNAFDVEIQFNTASQEFTLSVLADLDIDHKTAGIDVEIAASRDQHGWSFAVSGTLELGKLETKEGRRFDLTYESLGQDQAPVLIATYTEHDRKELDLGDLVGKLGDVDLHGVKLAIPGAVFAWQPEKDGKKGVKLLGLNVQGGLDLTAIQFPNIPFPHDSADAGLSARLDFQLALTDRAWTNDDDGLRSAIAARGFALSEGEIKAGANLRAQLRLGNETRTLDAPPSARNVVVPEKIANEAQKNAPGNEADAQPGGQDNTHWLDLHRKIGPLRFERIGLRFLTTPDPRVALLLDAGFELAGLQVSLDGLKMESSLGLDKFEPKFSLSGLGIKYRNPAIEIGGALLLMDNGFAGNVIIKGKKFSLSAMGVFQVVGTDKQPSLFIYATLDAALGGPPFFYITGLAAGIGYNRDVVLPEAEGVKDFPLVQWVLPPDPNSPDNALPPPKRDDPLAVIEVLAKVMPVAIGKGFAAIGVHFTSFKVLDSFALLVAKFGPHFELDVLGISTLASPPGDGVARVVNATLMLRAKFAPEEGILAVRAVLAADSYVLSKSCHLGGGFAFSAWFKDQLGADNQPIITAGDFALTLGGYHPEFNRPTHYPVVPRLSLEWAVNANLSLKGSAYFALTGSHVMAGGRFEAAWISEDIRAMFVAQADFLMTWKPYHYDVKLLVAISAEVTLRRFCNFHASLDASADVHLWGPEFSGSVRVHVMVLGFDLPLATEFGEGPPKPKAIGWPAFRKSFLPEPKDGTIFAFGVRSGLLRAGQEPEKIPLVSRDALTLAFETPIPLSEMPIKNAGEKSPNRPAIAPMGLAAAKDDDAGADVFTSRLQFQFWFGNSPPTNSEASLQLVELGNEEFGAPKCEDGAVVRRLNYNSPIGLLISPIKKAMPAAAWGPSNTSRAPDGGIYLEPQGINADRLVENLVVGFEIIPFTILSKDEMAKKGVPLVRPSSRNADTPDIEVLLSALTPAPGTSSEFSLEQREKLLRAYGLTPEVIAA
jgi:hypothetical protein